MALFIPSIMQYRNPDHSACFVYSKTCCKATPDNLILILYPYLWQFIVSWCCCDKYETGVSSSFPLLSHCFFFFLLFFCLSFFLSFFLWSSSGLSFNFLLIFSRSSLHSLISSIHFFVDFLLIYSWVSIDFRLIFSGFSLDILDYYFSPSVKRRRISQPDPSIKRIWNNFFRYGFFREEFLS